MPPCPCRVLWLLSDDMVGPAANQLAQAVAAHLPGDDGTQPLAAAAASAAPAAAATTRAATGPTAAAATAARELAAPQLDGMDAGTSLQSRQPQPPSREAEQVSANAAAQAQRTLDAATTPAAQEAASAALRQASAHLPPVDPAVGSPPRQAQPAQRLASPGNAKRLRPASDAAAAGAGASSQARGMQLTQLPRSSSSPMEVDGQAAGPGEELPLEQHYPELQELLPLLGCPSDATSAIAIAHKRQLLLQHFQQQRRQAAEAAATAAAAAAAQAQRGGDMGAAGGEQGEANAPMVELASSSSFRRSGSLQGEGGGGSEGGGAPNAGVISAAERHETGEGQLAESAEGGAQGSTGGGVEGARQLLQMSSFKESAELAEWQARQEEAHLARQEQQLMQRAASVPTAGASGGGVASSLQDAALESLIELASLPERLAGSVPSFKMAQALCLPAMLPGSGGDAASGGAGAAPVPPGSGPRRPVVVEAEREAFSQLLLHRNAIMDHIPDRYMEAIEALCAAYGVPPRRSGGGGLA